MILKNASLTDERIFGNSYCADFRIDNVCAWTHRGTKKRRAQTDTVELANLKEVVGFYKATFDDLKSQINTLTERLKEIEVENIKLKNNLHELNRQLKKQNG